MWLLVALILFGIFLLFPFFGLFLTILLLFLPIMLFISRPSVRVVYTKTFPTSSNVASKNRDHLEIIDVEYTEHPSLEK